MLQFGRSAVFGLAILVLAACGGGDEDSTDSETAPELEQTSEEETPAAPEDASTPQDPGSPGTYSSGSFTGTVSGDVTADISEQIVAEGLTAFMPGMAGVTPNVATLQFGTFETTYVLISVSNDTGLAPGSFTFLTGGVGFADDGSEGQCTIEVITLEASNVAGSVTCSGLQSDDGTQTIDVQGEFAATP